MSKNFDEKFFDVRTMARYLKKGVLKKSDVDAHLKHLPDDKNNFELTVFDEEEFGGLGESSISEEEIANMPPIREEDIDKFDFLDDGEDAD